MLKAEVTKRGFDLDAGILRVKRNPNVRGLPKYIVINGADSDEAQLETIVAWFLNMLTEIDGPDYVLSYFKLEEVVGDGDDSEESESERFDDFEDSCDISS